MRTSLPVMKNITDYRAQTQVLPQHLLLPENIKQVMNSQNQDQVLKNFFDYYFNLVINIIKIQEKPFNPMMCETFTQEYQIDDLSLNIFGEQIENHPPTTLYKIIFRQQDKYCVISSKSSLEADVHMSAITVLRTGWNIMKLSNGYTFVFNIPTFDVKNFMFGQRYGIFRDKSTIYWNNKDQKLDIFNLQVEQLESQFNKLEINFEEEKHDNKQQQHIYIQNDQITIKGNISQGKIHIILNNNQDHLININYSKQNYYEECQIKQNQYLQSDSRTRKDIQLYLEGKEDEATEQKIIYEERQRADRKLRNSE